MVRLALIAILAGLPAYSAAAVRVVPVRVTAAAAGGAAAGAGVRLLSPVTFNPSILPVLPALNNPALGALGLIQAAKKVGSEQAAASPVKTPQNVPTFSASAVAEAPAVRGRPFETSENLPEERKPATTSERLRDTSQKLSIKDTQKRLGRLTAVFDGSHLLWGTPTVPTEQDRRAIQAKTSPKRAYLEEVAGLSEGQLLSRLGQISGRGYKAHEYKEAKSELFSNTDNFKKDGRRGVIGAYSNVFVPGDSGDGTRYGYPGDSNGDGFNDRGGMNVEHLWPQSYFHQRSPMRSDLHHLMATFVHPNSERSRYPFGEVPDTSVEYRNNAGAKLGAGVFEPPDTAKGRVARGLLYFYTRYNSQDILPRGAMDIFWNSRIETLLKWNRDFPPDAFEGRRNDLVEQYQGNRNPFVDDHTLADKIGAESFRFRNRGPSARRFVQTEAEAEPVVERNFRQSPFSVGSYQKQGKSKNRRGHRKKKRKHGR